MLTFLIFFLSECSCTERFGTAWDITHYATAILLYQQTFSSIFLWEKGNVVVSWWYQLQCWGLIASWVPLRQIIAPQVIPSLFPPTTALACWSGYSQHAQKGSAWVYFSQCLFPTSPPAWQNPNLCLSCSHSPHEPLALQGFIKVYGISCCLMPSTAAYFPKRNTLYELLLGFSVQAAINPWRALLTERASFAAGVISTALTSLLCFFQDLQVQ